MYKFLIFVTLCYWVYALPDVQPSNYAGCACVIMEDGRGLLLCNGTHSAPACERGSIEVLDNGATYCKTIEDTACGKSKKQAHRNKEADPRGAMGPVGVPAIRTAPVETGRSLFSYIWSPFEYLLRGLYNTVVEVIIRAISYSISRIIDMIVVAGIVYCINKFWARVKGQWPSTKASHMFPGSGYTLVE